MAFADLMNKIRHWDNRMAKWIIRHFYILFFEVLLVFIFLLFFANAVSTIDLNVPAVKENLFGRLLFLQTVNTLIIVFLLLLNSFWMLYIFRIMIRMQTTLRDVSFNTARLKKHQS